MNTITKVENPFVQAMREEESSTESARDEVLARRRERMEFWMSTMRNDSGKRVLGPTWNERLRASELAAKADGDFADESNPGPQLVTYRELLMTRAGTFVEVTPTHQIAMDNADLSETIDDVPEYAIEGFGDE